MFHILYKDSIGNKHKLHFKKVEYNSMMELIWDRGLEDWGECRGRAWCGTCHVKTETRLADQESDIDERICLNQLENKTTNSRLACQLFLDEKIHKKEFEFIGDG